MTSLKQKRHAHRAEGRCGSVSEGLVLKTSCRHKSALTCRGAVWVSLNPVETFSDEGETASLFCDSSFKSRKQQGGGVQRETWVPRVEVVTGRKPRLLASSGRRQPSLPAGWTRTCGGERSHRSPGGETQSRGMRRRSGAAWQADVLGCGVTEVRVHDSGGSCWSTEGH